MKGFISVLNSLVEEDVEYNMIHEYDQIRLVFPRAPHEYIVCTRHETFHVNNVNCLDGNQLHDYIIGLGERQSNRSIGDHNIMEDTNK